MGSTNEKLDLLLDKLGFNLMLLAKVIIIVVIAFVLERIIHFLLQRAKRRKIVSGRDEITQYRFLRNATRFIVGAAALLAIIYSIPSVKHLAVTLFAGAGILVALIGLAAQKAFANIISGVFIVAFKPFRVGDTIKVSDRETGLVEDITLRHTVLVTGENRRIIIPNSLISDETIVNSTIREEATREYVDVSIAYENSIDKAIGVIQAVAMANPDFRDRRTAEEVEAGVHPVMVRVVRLGENGVDLRAFVWAENPVLSRFMRYDLLKHIKEQFDREGITIPYPHRVIVHKEPTTRTGA